MKHYQKSPRAAREKGLSPLQWAPSLRERAAVESASSLDRIWFERHPRRRVYMRRFLAGELPLPDGMPPPGLETYVIVVQVETGIRLRVPIGLPDDATGGPGLPRWTEEQMLAAVPPLFHPRA